MRERKLLLRALIDHVQVTVDRTKGSVSGHIIWEGGATSPLSVSLPRRGDSAAATDPAAVEAIKELLNTRNDQQIADELNRRGLATALGKPFKAHSVKHIRLTRNMTRSLPAPSEPAGAYLNLTEAQSQLGISRASLHRWLTSGFATGHQDQNGRWQIKVDDDLKAKIATAVPPGWARIDQAAKAMGVSPQTVRDRIARGEMEVIQVRRGRLLAQAVRLPPEATGLFDRPT